MTRKEVIVKRLWRRIKNFFKRRNPSTPAKPRVPAPTTPSYGDCKRIAIIVGHDARSGGARLYDGRNEYKYNTDVALRVLEKAKALALDLDADFNKAVKIFYRDGVGIKGACRAAAEWGADLSLELHFNAAGVPKARGAEMLVIDGDIETAKKARIILDDLVASFGSKLRHDNGIKWMSRGGRGYNNLKYARSYGITYPMLIEPFFGDYETEESKKYVERLAGILLNG